MANGSPTIVPVSKGLYLCDYYTGYDDGKSDLYGLFNAIRPAAGFPHEHGRFCVFAQLANGLGPVSFFIDIRDASSDELIYTTIPRALTFPDRHTTIQMVVAIEGCVFERPGLYLLELFCENTWVCDTTLVLAGEWPGGES